MKTLNKLLLILGILALGQNTFGMDAPRPAMPALADGDRKRDADKVVRFADNDDNGMRGLPMMMMHPGMNPAPRPNVETHGSGIRDQVADQLKLNQLVDFLAKKIKELKPLQANAKETAKQQKLESEIADLIFTLKAVFANMNEKQQTEMMKYVCKAFEFDNHYFMEVFRKKIRQEVVSIDVQGNKKFKDIYNDQELQEFFVAQYQAQVNPSNMPDLTALKSKLKWFWNNKIKNTPGDITNKSGYFARFAANHIIDAAMLYHSPEILASTSVMLANIANKCGKYGIPLNFALTTLSNAKINISGFMKYNIMTELVNIALLNSPRLQKVASVAPAIIASVALANVAHRCGVSLNKLATSAVYVGGKIIGGTLTKLSDIRDKILG